jgi:TIGR03009 family protein
MRLSALVLATGLLSGLPALAQTKPTVPPGTPATPPAPAPAPAASPEKLDHYLMSWEQGMKSVQTLGAQLDRIDKDKVAETVTKFSGYAYYMKAGTGPSALNLAMLELKLAGKADIAEKYICTGTYVYQYVPAQKEIRYYELPRPKPGQVGEDNFLTFLFGMKAEEARRRYVLHLAKEDNDYVYIDVVPRFPADKADFQRARLVLNKTNFLPRQLWFEHPNGNETIWDIPKLHNGMALDRRAFEAPKAPAGWRIVPGIKNSPPGSTPAAPAPRVVRPSGEK